MYFSPRRRSQARSPAIHVAAGQVFGTPGHGRPDFAKNSTPPGRSRESPRPGVAVPLCISTHAPVSCWFPADPDPKPQVSELMSLFPLQTPQRCRACAHNNHLWLSLDFMFTCSRSDKLMKERGTRRLNKQFIAATSACALLRSWIVVPVRAASPGSSSYYYRRQHQKDS